MNIGDVVENLRRGRKMARRGWNGKGQWLTLAPKQGLQCNFGYVISSEFVLLRTLDNAYVPWLCSQSDLLADDWEIVKGSVKV